MFEINFADNLKVLRLKNQLTQIELAKLVQVEQSTIARYETGKYEPKFDVAAKLAKIFDVTVEELYGSQTEEIEQATAEQLVDGQAEEGDTNDDEKTEFV